MVDRLMIWMARLLMREKWRKTLTRYGSAGCAGFGLILLILASAVGTAFSHLLQKIAPVQIPVLLNRVWLGWVMAGVLIGKDLTWRIHLDRLKRFPVSGFGRLYLLGFLLSFASFPLLLILVIFVFAGSTQRFSLIGLAATLAAYCLFAASIRLAVSCARTGIFGSSSLSKGSKRIPLTLIPLIIAWNLAPVFDSSFESLLPGYQFGLVLTGMSNLLPALLLVGFVVLLSIADFTLQREVTYAGVGGPPVSRKRILSSGGLLLHPSRPGTLWRISLLGWLRNRNAVLLLIWGTSYGFFFMYFSGLNKAGDFMLFSWMVLIFHSYLRGNLLGVDHRGVWLYYMFPAPVRLSLQSKNQTLSLLQASMVAAVLLPGVLHPSPDMDIAAWAVVISYALSSILLGEIAGLFFSLRHPEPIERSDHFSGGTAPGALIIPFLQIAFLAVCLYTIALTRRLPLQSELWFGVITVPVLLYLARRRLEACWTQKKMVTERRTIMSGLSVFSS